jgi:hypothetical protein
MGRAQAKLLLLKRCASADCGRHAGDRTGVHTFRLVTLVLLRL